MLELPSTPHRVYLEKLVDYAAAMAHQVLESSLTTSRFLVRLNLQASQSAFLLVVPSPWASMIISVGDVLRPQRDILRHTLQLVHQLLPLLLTQLQSAVV